jgi:hypothetical protein
VDDGGTVDECEGASGDQRCEDVEMSVVLQGFEKIQSYRSASMRSAVQKSSSLRLGSSSTIIILLCVVSTCLFRDTGAAKFPLTSDNLEKFFQTAIDEIIRKKFNVKFDGVLVKASAWLTNRNGGKVSKGRAVNEMIHESEKYLSSDVEWDFMGMEKDVLIWKLKRSSLSLKKEDSHWPCVKSSTVIEIDSKSLLDYLMDSSKVQEYNKYSAGRSDVEIVSAKTKVVWNRLNIPVGIKPYDFCTLMHSYTKPAADEIVLVSKFTVHPSVPVHSSYGRSEKIIGLNILKSMKSIGSKKRTEITCISHQRYANTPPYMIESSMKRGKVNYLRKLKTVLEKR